MLHVGRPVTLGGCVGGQSLTYDRVCVLMYTAITRMHIGKTQTDCHFGWKPMWLSGGFGAEKLGLRMTMGKLQGNNANPKSSKEKLPF